jgi:hypothetical protein
MNSSLDSNRPPTTIQTISQYARNSYGGVRNKINPSYQQISDSPSKISESYNLKTYTNDRLNKDR